MLGWLLWLVLLHQTSVKVNGVSLGQTFKRLVIMKMSLCNLKKIIGSIDTNPFFFPTVDACMAEHPRQHLLRAVVYVCVQRKL
jgi:hypothetical protein